jgi:hypothetical protein
MYTKADVYKYFNKLGWSLEQIKELDKARIKYGYPSLLGDER